MKKMVHDVFGELIYDEDELWSKVEKLSFFDKIYDVKIYFVDDEEKFLQTQIEAYQEFEQSKDKLIADVEQAVFQYYHENIEEFREYLEEDEFKEKTPNIKTTGELKDLITEINMTYQVTHKEISFMFECIFDDTNGVGVHMEDSVIIETDVQASIA